MKGKENTRLKRRRISTSGRMPPCTLLHTAVQARKVVLRNRWSGIVLGYRRVSAELPIISVFCQPLSVASALIRTRRLVREYPPHWIHSAFWSHSLCIFTDNRNVSVRVAALSIYRFLWHVRIPPIGSI